MEPEESGSLTSDYTISYSNKNSMVLIQKRNIDQWNRMDSPRISPDTFDHLIYDKEARIYNGERHRLQ